MNFEDMLVYAACEMGKEELGRYIGVLEDEIDRSHTQAMLRAVTQLKNGAILELVP